MDFLEDMELYEQAMRNAYQIITKRKTLDDIYYDLEEEFTKHIGKKAYVEGRKMGWRNLNGEKYFTIKKPIDMFREIAPNCDLTYKMEKVKEGEYEVRISHHDSPTGEFYKIKIKDNKANKPLLYSELNKIK